ncbi:unnamed protein product [Enterobius vermicularis]|uniref:ABC transmembrane type-1 domain-containing protein n=1 Tax=Enterobius vermicularis TaxID=51028 RepID=A0A0N4V7Y6_ENTVE|nr:unnamed protein product [Enterobius vermicularis]
MRLMHMITVLVEFVTATFIVVSVRLMGTFIVIVVVVVIVVVIMTVIRVVRCTLMMLMICGFAGTLVITDVV